MANVSLPTFCQHSASLFYSHNPLLPVCWFTNKNSFGIGDGQSGCWRARLKGGCFLTSGFIITGMGALWVDESRESACVGSPEPVLGRCGGEVDVWEPFPAVWAGSHCLRSPGLRVQGSSDHIRLLPLSPLNLSLVKNHVLDQTTEALLPAHG